MRGLERTAVIRRLRRPPSGLSLLVALGFLLFAERGGPPVAAADPTTFHCALDSACPEVMVAGDPFATLGGGPAPFRGYGDPSLEYDPSTGTLWMSYSWLNVLVTSPGPPPVIDFGVHTHLARSDDGGASFTFVEPVNPATALNHPDSGTAGWASHEVSTLVREGPGSWQMMWLTYFDPAGSPPFLDPYYQRRLGPAPNALGAATPWIRGSGTSSSFGPLHNLSSMPQLADCTAFTEPALFSYGSATYLATNCVVFSGGVRQDAQERLVLLRQEASGYSFIGNLLDGADAVDAGGTRIEQADIALSRTGEILLIGTPIQTAMPNHLGCIVFEIADITTAQVLRDGAGKAVRLVNITGEDATIGPGLCAYDSESATGILMVLHKFVPNTEVEFSLRATGIHPMDTDRDGAENTMDLEDDGDGYTDTVEAQVGTDSQVRCGFDGWPSDFVSGGIPDSTDRVTLNDVLSFVIPARRLGTSPGDPDFSARWDLVPGITLPFTEAIALNDLLSLVAGSTGYPPMLGGERAFSGPACPWPP